MQIQTNPQYTLSASERLPFSDKVVVAKQLSQSQPSDAPLSFEISGLVSTVSTLLWGRALGACQAGRGPALVFAATMLGALPVLLHPGPTAMFLSALLFGGSFLAGPTSITIVAQRQLPASSWTAAISLLTVGFALGQAAGPALAGAISDALGSVAAGFWVSPALLGIAACVNLLQRPARASSM
ncbi:YbfB/YjiJ family MFS transporter [Enhydrobacter sp.]|uniref:YbfB/YjiJ family MFS transporter n=1 Tax=Enhydrobacter sp. TaxID=1894999 RepID=UPI00344FC08F